MKFPYWALPFIIFIWIIKYIYSWIKYRIILGNIHWNETYTERVEFENKKQTGYICPCRYCSLK